jgi:flagellar biosynthesis protein FlhF
LSTGINESEMLAAAENFGRLNFDSYIFTKTDETRAKGVIVNHLMKHRKPVSFVTNGQRVPEDIFKATRTNILGLMFR